MARRLFHIILLALYCQGEGVSQWPLLRPHPMKEAPRFLPRVVTQDRHGWIWIGGEGGLWRFDGQEYHPAALPAGAAVTALFASKNRLWVGLNNGRVAYLDLSAPFLPQPVVSSGVELPPSARFQSWWPSIAIPEVPITGFAEDADGNLWIATYGAGLFCDRQGGTIPFGLPASKDIYAIAKGEQDQIWVATDAGVYICHWSTAGKPVVRQLGKIQGLPDEITTALLPDPAGGMWVGTYDKGVWRYDYKKGRFETPVSAWPGYHVSSLAQFGQTELWIGTEGRGCFRYDFKEQRLHMQAESRDRIRALFKDREGLLWILSDRSGVFSANVRFSKLDIPNSEVQAVLVDKRRNMWVGTAAGLFKREGERLVPVLPRQTNIISLAESADGRILAGSFGEGLWVLDPAGSKPFQISERDGLSNGSILSIAVAGDTIWLATLGGVQYCAGGKWNFRALQELGAGYVYKILVDAGGRVWFGADGIGLSVLEKGRWRRMDAGPGKDIKTVTDICTDAQGQVWFISPNSGLWRFDGSTYRQYDTEQQLHSRNILGLERDGNGNLVLLYEDGLDILEPQTGHVAYFNGAAGLPPFQTALNAHCTDNEDHVWLGVGEGLLRVAAFQESFLIDPQPSITAVTVFMEPVDFVTRRSFAHDQNYLVFYFTGLWYTHPESVRYRYRLEGYDLGWKVTNDRLASYSNLPHGHYTFRFQSSEHGTFEQTPEAGYAFTIERPYWTRWWFVLLGTTLGALLLYSWVRAREARFNRVAALRRQKSESQFAALKSQINPHFLFNSFNTLITLIEENPKAAVEYVEHLSDFYRSMMAYREKDLISIREEMELVHNFYFLLKKRFEDNFRLRTDLGDISGYIMPLTLQMLLENAVKHNVISKARPLEVEIAIEDKQWVVVRNNLQRKNRPEPSTHFGLQSLKDRYRMFGNFQVIVEEDERYFTVKVPIIPAL